MKLMATGHRTIHHQDLVRDRIKNLFEKAKPDLVISGGAEGADTLFAEVAWKNYIQLLVMYPNKYYTKNYTKSYKIPKDSPFVDSTFVVSRPTDENWRERWGREKWWTDNFKRNQAMIFKADYCVVISPLSPLELLNRTGGTASCVKDIKKLHSFNQVFWIPDDPNIESQWFSIREPNLFS